MSFDISRMSARPFDGKLPLKPSDYTSEDEAFFFTRLCFPKFPLRLDFEQISKTTNDIFVVSITVLNRVCTIDQHF